MQSPWNPRTGGVPGVSKRDKDVWQDFRCHRIPGDIGVVTVTLLDFVLVFILAILAGGWAVTAGVVFGLNPLGVLVAAVFGSLTYAVGVLLLGGRWRDQLVTRLWPGAQERIDNSRAGEIMERWGVPGLAVGSILIGPSLSLLAALVFGVDRRIFFAWFAAATVVGYALLTVFWTLVT